MRLYKELCYTLFGDHMFSETRKYTEEEYISKEELSKQVSGIILEEVWKQIESYRSLFRKTYQFGSKEISLILHQNCMEELLEITMAMFQFKQQCTGSTSLQKACFLYGEDSHWLINIGRYVNLKELSYSEYAILEERRIPLLIRIFFLYEFCDDASSWAQILFLQNNCEFPVSLIHWKSICKDNQKDLTREFIQFLHMIYKNMIRYKGSLMMHENKQEQALDILIEQYPQLQKEHLSFYVHHRNLYHAYTIRQYTEFHHVSYETARCALEKLKDYQFYTRRKIGKRFVYECC